MRLAFAPDWAQGLDQVAQPAHRFLQYRQHALDGVFADFLVDLHGDADSAMDLVVAVQQRYRCTAVVEFELLL